MTKPRILLVDDDPAWIELYHELLEPEGYALEDARSMEEARTLISGSERFAVAIVDLRLAGSSRAEDMGLDLVPDLRRASPSTQVMIVTGYPSEGNITQAFGEGVFDFLIKSGEEFGVIVKAKVRRAIELYRERSFSLSAAPEIEAALKSKWDEVLAASATKGALKGALLEEFIDLLFRTMPGLERCFLNRKNRVEEIDALVENRSTHPLLSKEGSVFLVECKHWSKKVSVEEITRFKGKIHDRWGRARLGFFIAFNGVTGALKAEVLRKPGDAELVVLLGRDDLAALVAALGGEARVEVLVGFWRRAVEGRI